MPIETIHTCTYIFSVSECTCHDVYRVWISNDLLEEVRLLCGQRELSDSSAGITMAYSIQKSASSGAWKIQDRTGRVSFVTNAIATINHRLPWFTQVIFFNVCIVTILEFQTQICYESRF